MYTTKERNNKVAPHRESNRSTGKNAIQLQDNRTKMPMQQKVSEPSIQKKANNTGLPDNLKSGIENLSGYSMDDVKVHYNSSKPAQLQALAYAQGSSIHIAPGQEKHLPHEAWHVVQQKQGRVSPTTQMKGVQINDNKNLEGEADRMGKHSVSKFSGKEATGTGAVAMLYRSGNNILQRQAVAQLAENEKMEAVKAILIKLFNLLKAGHNNKTIPLLLNALSALVTAIRYVRNDNSTGATVGTSLVALSLAVDAAITAVQEWRAATGEGKDLWKKRVDALEKLSTVFVQAAGIFTFPFNPTTGAFIVAIGLGSIKVLRSGYDALADYMGKRAEGENKPLLPQ
jgi:hypothetical protein